jgi:hypothetical protein
MYMDFNAEDREDKGMDMDMEYDMIPMPMYMNGGVPSMMPLEMPPNMSGTMGMQGFMPLMMQPSGAEMFPAMMPNMMTNMDPNMMGVEQMLPGSMVGMNMMEAEDDYEDIEEDMTRKKDCGPKEVNKILMKIQKYNPGIFRYLRMYGVPYPVAKKIVRKIVKVTLMYYED